MINDDIIDNNKQDKALLNINNNNNNNNNNATTIQSSSFTRDELESAKILQHLNCNNATPSVPSTSNSASPAAIKSTMMTNVREGNDKVYDEFDNTKGLDEVSATTSSPSSSIISSSFTQNKMINDLSSRTNNDMVGLDTASSTAMASNPLSGNGNTFPVTIGNTNITSQVNGDDNSNNNLKKRLRDCDSDPESDDDDEDEDEDDDGETGNKKGNSKKRVRHPVYPLWTVEEDELLMQKNIDCGNDWAKISTFLTGRSRVDVKVRYKSIVSAEKKLWNIKDDERIFQLHKIHNADWKTISSHFNGRTKNAVRVRYKELKRLAFQPIKAPTLGSAKQIFYKRCHPHFHRNSTVIGSSDSVIQEDVQQKSMPAPQLEKSKKESVTASNSSKASSSSIFNDDAKKETEAKNNTAASSLFDTSIVIDDSMKISPQITQKEVNSRILTSIVHSSPQVRFPGPRPTIFCAPTPATMNLPMHYPTMMNCYPTPGWPAQPTLTAIPTMFQQMPPNPANGIPLMYSLFPQMPQMPQMHQFPQAPSKGI